MSHAGLCEVAPVNDADHALLVVSVNRTFPRLNTYDAARYAWRVSLSRAKQVDYVLATKNRQVVGVFRPSSWLPATRENFPEFDKEMPGRIGFVGCPADDPAARRYLHKKLPPDFSFSGNGYRYAGSLAS